MMKRLAATAAVVIISFIGTISFQNFTFLKSQNACDGRYRSSTGNAMFFYQGDYNKLAANAEQLACLMAKFDLVQLTHAFDVKPQREFVGPIPPHALALRNGGSANLKVKFLDYAYRDAQGRGIAYVIERLRALRGNTIKIYGYVPATADNPLGHWNHTPEAQNFICPRNSSGFVDCVDFRAWVTKWDSLYSRQPLRYIDGIFVDMVNPVYTHEFSWQKQVALIKVRINPATRQPYRIMANTLETNSSYYYPSTQPYSSNQTYKLTTTVLPPNRPMIWAGKHLGFGDSVLVEGFYVKSGRLNIVTDPDGRQHNETSRILADARFLSENYDVGWSAISSELAYKSPLLMPRYIEFRNSYARNYEAHVRSKLDSVYALYQSFRPRYGTMLPSDHLAYNEHYGYRKTVVDMSRFMVDYNYLTAKGFSHNSVCTPFDDSNAGLNGITSQEGPSTCFLWKRFVDCSWDNFRTGSDLFRRNGGSYYTYTEANLGTYSGLISTCPDVGI